jgi:hypothetical protein
MAGGLRKGGLSISKLAKGETRKWGRGSGSGVGQMCREGGKRGSESPGH